MKNLIALVLLATISIFATTACVSELRGAEMLLENDEYLGEDFQNDYAKCHLEVGEDWGTLYRFEQNGLRGFRDADETIIIEAQYYGAHRFSEGLAFVIGVEGREDQTGFIDLTGNLVIPLPTALSAGTFSEGLAHVSIREWDWNNEEPFTTSLPGPFIFINRAGQNVFCQEFVDARPFADGLSRVRLLNGNVAFIDGTGANAFGLEFRNARDFDEYGYVMVTLLNGTITYMDRSGNFASR